MNIAIGNKINYNNFFINSKEGIFMAAIMRVLPESINGFKITEDMGMADNGLRYVTVICKSCNNEFNTSVYHLKKIKSCGCVKYTQMKELPPIINGFKIIKDLGFKKFGDQKKRRVIAECKACYQHYECTPTYLKDRKNCGCMKRGSIVSQYAKSHPRLTGIYKHMKTICNF